MQWEAPPCLRGTNTFWCCGWGEGCSTQSCRADGRAAQALLLSLDRATFTPQPGSACATALWHLLREAGGENSQVTPNDRTNANNKRIQKAGGRKCDVLAKQWHFKRMMYQIAGIELAVKLKHAEVTISKGDGITTFHQIWAPIFPPPCTCFPPSHLYITSALFGSSLLTQAMLKWQKKMLKDQKPKGKLIEAKHGCKTTAHP